MKKKTKPAVWMDAFPNQIKAKPFKRLIAKPGQKRFQPVVSPFLKKYAKMFNGPRRSKKRSSVTYSLRRERRREHVKLRHQWTPGKTCAACHAPEVEVHHQRGRVGALLNDQRFWIPLCRRCHRNVHDHPDASRILRVLVGDQWMPLLCARGDWNKIPK